MRIGLGYDIHKLVLDRDLILGGVKIPYNFGLLGHSDADVLVHSIIDAIFGSIALRDIGYHFPDNDEKYKNINSMDLLKETCNILTQNGYEIVNIDSNIICQRPKLAPYIEDMRKNIAHVCNIEVNQVSIKAKTNEEMDATGSNLAISTNAVVLVEKIMSR